MPFANFKSPPNGEGIEGEFTPAGGPEVNSEGKSVSKPDTESGMKPSDTNDAAKTEPHLGEHIADETTPEKTTDQDIAQDVLDAVAATSQLANEKAIKDLMMRLSDLLFLTSGSMPPQERALVDDIMSRLFEKAPRITKLNLVARLLQHSEPPPSLVRTMLHSENEVALPILRAPVRLKQADLISVITTAGPMYQKAVAEREDLQTAVCDSIIQCGDVSTIRVLLRNATSVISRNGFIRLAKRSLTEEDVLGPLIERTDFPPDLAHLVFWWSPGPLRQKIIERFASSRQTVFEVVPSEMTRDFAAMGPEVANAFRMVRKAQRMDREKIDKAFDELETGDANDALDALAEGSHLKAETIAQIFDDNGGEALGVFSKAVGIGRERLYRLRSILAVRKGEVVDEGEMRNDSVSLIFDTLSTDKADLILRYWDRATREIEI